MTAGRVYRFFIEDRNVVSPSEAVINIDLREQTEALGKLRHPSRSRKLKAFLEAAGATTRQPFSFRTAS